MKVGGAGACSEKTRAEKISRSGVRFSTAFLFYSTAFSDPFIRNLSGV